VFLVKALGGDWCGADVAGAPANCLAPADGRTAKAD